MAPLTPNAAARPGRQDRPAPAWRVLIAGGGAPGLTLALGLKQALGEAVETTICDPGLASGERRDGRAFALSPAVARMFGALGLWTEIRSQAEPILRMTITDSRLEDAIRPDYLAFAGSESEPLGFMVEAEVLARALLGRCREAGVSFQAHRVLSFAPAGQGVSALREDGGHESVSLLVAADGARSRLRDEARIAWTGRTYDQSGLSATIAHERDHGGRAVQHFLPSGPFAILPLPAGGASPLPFRSSVVWTERTDCVPALLGLPPDQLQREIAVRVGDHLGALALQTDLRAHPLAIGQARRMAGERFALLGDAAHEIHPLAGQGLNLGLGDAAALAERVVDAVRLGLDPGSRPVLDAYERDRRGAILAMAATTDVLNRLFSNDRLPLRVLRDLGLGLVDRAGGLKDRFVDRASGETAHAPRLMRGGGL